MRHRYRIEPTSTCSTYASQRQTTNNSLPTRSMIRLLKLIFEQIVFAVVVVTVAYTLHGAKKSYFSAKSTNTTDDSTIPNVPQYFDPDHAPPPISQEDLLKQQENSNSENFVIEIGDGEESEDGDVIVDKEYQKVFIEENESLKNVSENLNITSFTERRNNCIVKMAEMKEYKAVPLLSFPGCGNTWTRYLIQQTTGIFTGSVYHDNGLWKGGYEGELEDPFDGNTIVQKVHRVRSNEFSGKMFRDYRKIYVFQKYFFLK